LALVLKEVEEVHFSSDHASALLDGAAEVGVAAAAKDFVHKHPEDLPVLLQKSSRDWLSRLDLLLRLFDQILGTQPLDN
jgi:hypothetical protein